MTISVRTLAVAVVSIIALSLVGFVVYDYYLLRKDARAVISYLGTPTDVKNAKGVPLNRSQLIDGVLRDKHAPKPAAAPLP